MKKVVVRGLKILIVALVTAVVVTPLRAQQPRPRLIVLLVVDQFRGDYVDKFQHQWTGGLHRLLTVGARFRQVDYPFFDTVTCAGHATIATGSLPSTHGMVMNTWWDRQRQAEVTCTRDTSTAVVSYGKPVPGYGDSAAALRTSTLADELRVQLSPSARLIGFSLKARAAIPLVGRRPDAVAWFDDSGTWVTSTAFSSAPVPEVAEFIGRHPVENDYGKTWERTLPSSAYLYEAPAIGVHASVGKTATFPHSLRGASNGPDRGFYAQWQSSPYSDEYLSQMALDVATRMRFGHGDQTDMIAIGFSALDKVGHDFGPDSHEIQDVLIRLDRTLGVFLAGLDRLVGADNYTVALTSDHGVSPIPERMKAAGVDAGRVATVDVTTAIETSLRRTLGQGRYVAGIVDGEVYLRDDAFDRMRSNPAAGSAVRRSVQAIPGVLDVYTRDRIEANQFEDDPIGRRLARSYDRERSGDMTVVLRPYWLMYVGATTHGSSYGFDTRVPLLLMGKGIAPGEYLEPASPADVAPTLAFLAGVTLPGAQGRVLTEALVRSAPSVGNSR